MSSFVIFGTFYSWCDRAMQIGVNRADSSWIKPYQEDQLISEVRGVLGETKDA